MIYLLQHGLMESAQRSPESKAVSFGGASLTYGELDRRSNQLANALRRNGCSRGDRIGILAEKSLGAVVGIHGILKAGGVYVPLDPNAPLRRLAYIIRDCGIRQLVISQSKLAVLPRLTSEAASLSSIVIEEAAETDLEHPPRTVLWEEVAEFPTEAPDNPSIENDLAYLLYTSGSTGVPKGVMISHLNSLTFVRWVLSTFSVGSHDRLSNHAPLHFDLSILDIFSTMAAGATLYPVPAETSTFPRALAEWISDNRISIWYSVPSILSMMVRHGGLERHTFEHLHTVFFAGEVFPVKYLRAWMQKVPHTSFYNLYGPTETNVITYHHVDSVPAEHSPPVPIGKACANMEVFARTDDGSIVTSPGGEGELYARGSFVAQGYWGDPEKTSQAFLANTDGQLSDRVYRTGDLVTLDEDGRYLFIGRRDHMVKRRGYRIELGEIESVLYSHAAVREAAVVAEPDDEHGSRLIALVVVDAGSEIGPSELTKHIANWLPKYMVPDELLLLESLPKTSTGKVDRQALLPAQTRREVSAF